MLYWGREHLRITGRQFQDPFLESISNTARSLLTSIQTVRHNKDDCAQLVEQTYQLLYGIVSLYIRSETGPDLPPSMLSHLGEFTETLHKIHTFVEAQKDKARSGISSVRVK
ncbi:hypothetical protein B0H14DRAFT_637754 [Mycena olivaceomarginata]|nr:hypothetical protein B0H14DRAFT_637754 [Mycena olivaceomarginata]